MFKPLKLKPKNEVNPIMTNEGGTKPLEQKISDASSSNSDTTEDDTEIKDIEEEDNNEEEQQTDNSYAEEDKLDDVDIAEEENEAREILKRETEKKAQEYAEKSLKQMINGEELLTNMQTFMESIRDLPENMYDKNFENYAIVLSNTTINGEKIFNDVEEAKQFINKIRNGAKTSKRYITPRAYKQFKQEIQKQLQLTPMISRNVKHRTNAINVYQY